VKKRPEFSQRRAVGTRRAKVRPGVVFLTPGNAGQKSGPALKCEYKPLLWQEKPRRATPGSLSCRENSTPGSNNAGHGGLRPGVRGS